MKNYTDVLEGEKEERFQLATSFLEVLGERERIVHFISYEKDMVKGWTLKFLTYF